MGVLDDAIREHLELKRRHGVPDEELQRQEEEALGPARRNVAQQHEAEPTPGQTATAEAEPPAEDGQETALFDMEGPGDATPAERAPVAEAVVHDETAEAESQVAEPPPAEETADHEPVAAEPTPVEPPPVEPPPVEPPPAEPALDEEAPVGEPGHEPEPELEDDEDLLAEDADPDDLDVLEDTPDFLQETPEHDRLWFEQKPPRDFDFD
jgi:hypothetical protein